VLTQVLRICLVAGARPNFMKIAPIIRALEPHEDLFYWRLVHTGQHYDKDMSSVFFDELNIPSPHYFLAGGSGTHAEQTARVMTEFEDVCVQVRPDLVIVVGDVNSTMACAITAKKLQIKVAHVEAGLRSRDWSMPEEVNRVVTDAVSDYHFATEQSGVDNLLAEGKGPEHVHFVGHVMIDNLLFQLEQLRGMDQTRLESSRFHALGDYGVVTLHRRSNVDEEATLASLCETFAGIAEKLPLVFPVHPRTRANLDRWGIRLPLTVQALKPLPYMEFLNLWSKARLVLTDSGGLQEETTALGVPCLTLRDETERPVTVSHGTNTVVGTDPNRIREGVDAVLAGEGKFGRIPPLWDGRAAERIVEVLMRETQAAQQPARTPDEWRKAAIAAS
jgi:UDP-N-acetylglucosamine 2-epimerase (non-hydrolysing)